MALSVSGRSFLFGCQERTDISTRILGAIHTVPKAVSHNPGVSLNLIISGHGFCGFPRHFRSEGGNCTFPAKEELTLVLGFWEPYLLFPSQ